jgi:hypothetical protein
MNLFLSLLKYSGITNKLTGTLISLYLLYLTRGTFLSFDILKNNIKHNYIYIIIAFIIFFSLLLILYKNFIVPLIANFMLKSESTTHMKILNYSLTMLSYISFILIDSLLKGFNKIPNNYGITQTMLLFNNNFEVKKIFSLGEKQQYLEEILPLLKNLSKDQINSIINNIDWELITCKNDIYLYLVSTITLERTKIVEQLNEPTIFNNFLTFLYSHPYGILIILIISLGLGWYFHDTILTYLKKALELFKEFLIEHRKKIIVDDTLVANQEMIGNQLAFINENLLNKEIDDKLISQIHYLQENLIRIQQELLTLNSICSKNEGIFLSRIASQAVDIQKILKYLTNLEDKDSLI